MRRDQRRDANEPEVVEALELNGYVVDRHYLPDPFDLAVRRIGSPLFLHLEVKTATGTLTAAQEAALAEGGIVVVRTPDEALRACEAFL